MQREAFDVNQGVRGIKFHQEPIPPSPDYVQTDEAIWNQSYLAKAMLQMKDRDTRKLKFPESCYTPYEYEKWLQDVNRTMEADHPDIGLYWGESRICRTSVSTIP